MSNLALLVGALAIVASTACSASSAASKADAATDHDAASTADAATSSDDGTIADTEPSADADSTTETDPAAEIGAPADTALDAPSDTALPAVCGMKGLGDRCADPTPACRTAFSCDLGRCIPQGRATCGGFANTPCKDRVINNCVYQPGHGDVGTCFSTAEYECLCAVAPTTWDCPATK